MAIPTAWNRLDEKGQGSVDVQGEGVTNIIRLLLCPKFGRKAKVHRQYLPVDETKKLGRSIVPCPLS